MAEGEREAVLWRAAADLARADGEAGAASALAQGAAMLLHASRARVWMIDHSRGYRMAASWPPSRGEQEPPAPPGLPRAVVLGAPVAAGPEPGSRSSLILPLQDGAKPLGALEVSEASRPDGPFQEIEGRGLAGLMVVAAATLASARRKAALENAHLETVERLTRLFDVGRSLGSTLDAAEIASRTVNRVLRALGVDAVYFWLPGTDEDSAWRVAAAAGITAEFVSDWTLPEGVGLAGAAAAARSTIRAAEAAEIPDLESREDLLEDRPIGAAAAAPMATDDDGPLEGVLEVVRYGEDASLEGAEVLLLDEIARTAAGALANARRLEAERRVSDLSALLDIAKDLGASLDPSQVAYTLSHKAAAVLHFGTSAVGVLKAGHLELESVSGQEFVDLAQPRNRALRDVLAFAVTLEEGFYAVREDDGSVDAGREDVRERLKAYFDATGAATFLAVPLQDDGGKMGVFAMDADAPYAFSERDIEAATLLGVQASVAIRNALLFRETPRPGLFAPLSRGAQKIGAGAPSKRTAWGLGVGLTALLLCIPVPLRVDGDVRVLPVRRTPTTAEIDGRVSKVLVREGDPVTAGQTLAELDDVEALGARDEAKARLDAALREQARFRAEGNVAEAEVVSARIEGIRADLDLWQRRLDRTALRAATSGIVVTPRVEETAGTRLARGDVFCEIVDPADQAVEVFVPEPDSSLVAPGMPVKVKLLAFPLRSIRATVDRLAVGLESAGEDRVVRARAKLANGSPALRTDMTGRAKITTGWTPAARVLLRRPTRWIWAHVWGWIP